MKNKNEKGLSIISSTIIIVSICIIIAIASIMWISGISSIFMNYDKIEIIDVWSHRSKIGILYKDGYANSFNDFFISIDFKNTGNTIIRICNIEINGKPFKNFSNNTKVTIGSIRDGWFLDPYNEETFIPIYPGEIGNLGIRFPLNAAFSGQKIRVTIYTVNGGEFHVFVILEEW